PPSLIYTLSLHDALPIWRTAVDELAPYPSGFPRSLVRNDVGPIASRHLGRHVGPVVQCADDRRMLARSLPDVQRRAGRVLHDARSEEHTSELQSLTNLVC